MPDRHAIEDAPREDSRAASEVVDTLRFMTCGSVDDGKSTLIGRLLHESGLILEDQLAALAKASDRYGTMGGEADYALLVDGLEAEREQGITIDVAHRFFATPRRRFIAADTPGHEQYTRNMVTGASNAELAILLVDVTKGLTRQTCRHAIIVSLLRIPHVILAVNKMDLVGFGQDSFCAVADAFAVFTAPLGFATVDAVPVSARGGDNVVRKSARTPWYSGPALLDRLETVGVAPREREEPFRLPVQWVCRPHAAFRGYAGRVAGGAVRVGDAVVASPSGRRSRVASILVGRESRASAQEGDSVLVTLTDELDISRGEVLAAIDAPPAVTDQFAAHLVWMDPEPMLPGRPYLIMLGAQLASVQVTRLKYRIDVETLQPAAERTLAMNEIGVVTLSAASALALDPYRTNRMTGGFILIDRFTNATVAAGLIDHSLERASNIRWQAFDVDRAARAALKHQKPTILWFTGLSGAGKSTIANLVEKQLYARGRHTVILDGDNVRHGLNRDLGFTDADRVENVRRVAEVAKLMTDAGLIVMVAFISPFRAERAMARGLVGADEFVEIFVDAPLATCSARDPKGLYARARAGSLRNFTGVDSPYEAPDRPELRLDTHASEPEALASEIIDYLERTDRLRPTEDRRG